METQFGFNVIILDKGFVYVGDCSRDTELLYIKNAMNIIQWGTTDGLNQLVTKGPTKNTKLSPACYIRVPWHSVISLLETDKKLWIKSYG